MTFQVDLAGNAEIALRMVREAKEIVYDTETSGLDWRYNAPVGYVVGAAAQTGHGAGGGAAESGSQAIPTPVDVVYVPVRHGGGGNLLGGRPLTEPNGEWQVHDFERALAKAFDQRNQTVGMGRVVGHHIKFDAHFSANAGIMLGRNLEDTQNNEAMLDEYARSYSLDSCATRHGVTAKLGDELYKHIATLFGGPADRKSMANFWRLAGNDQLGYEYAVGDGVSTMELVWSQRKDIEAEEMTLVHQVESDLIWTLFRMERKGIPIDIDLIDELRAITEAQINEIIAKLGVGFNSRSPKMVRELMEQAGHTDWPTTDKGNPSFTESWLKKNPVGRDIISIRQKSNLLNSFVNPLAERHMFKGRVHATLNQLKSDDTGTISGRFSCSDPNLQQVPKRVKELAKPFRRLFIADEGKLFWERDWSQCEPRLFAHYSGDKALLEGYNSEPFVDAHQTVANLLNVERDPTAKRMNMGIFTGMQPRTFADHMGWDVQRATVAHRAWFDAFPGVRAFQDKAKARLKNRGFVYTLLKRRCRLEHPRFAYRGTSKIIQGSNADIAKYKLLEMDLACEAAGDICQVLMTVHDSFNGQCDDTPEARALLDELVRIMEDVQGEPFNLRVPFVAEGFEGPNWSVASFGESGA